ncbi:hypothetical protein DL546_001093 [Coniochaeta pulveracea]|uniref:ribonuclease H n=1 Tax=Coniochaeta pulveracea TaxID=177199 RepID=A0A420YNE6_9PEZI|nr:hypothetical protein DL546_001093 [Coniochaeta pulveracea]
MPPLRWYLAQGLIPLTEDSSDDDEGPYQLADGRLVCGLHGLVVCGKCCVDYSFMDDNHVRDEDELPELDNDHVYFPQDSDYEDMYGRRTRRGTGQVFPTKFVPPNDSVKPTELFTLEKRFNGFDKRYTLQDDRGTVLVHTDGACLNNGQPNPKAGWAFSLGLRPSGNPLVYSGRLEQKGPFGQDGSQTSNRAELRAIIAALRSSNWPEEGVHTLVIATDSEYAVEGSTRWVKKWIKDDWKKYIYERGRGGRRREDVKNRDLWEALLGEMERCDDQDMIVKLWRIPREWNCLVDAAAKEAAGAEHAPETWEDPIIFHG